MRKTFIAYHGDLDIFKVDKLPKGASKPATVNEHVAQHGTATGHKHLVTGELVFEVFTYGDSGLAYVFGSTWSISHEEHRTHDFEPGIYIIEHEQEEDPRTGLLMEVVD